NAVVVLCAVLMAVLVLSYLDNRQARVAAQQALQTEVHRSLLERQENSRQLDLANQHITLLVQEVEANAGRQSQLLTEIAALEGQVRQLGGKPVVTEQPRQSPSSSSSPPTSSPRPSPSPPPSSPPPNKPPP